MAGPGRCPSIITIGVSVIPASPKASTISEKPPPEVAVSDLTPAKEAPIAILIAEISSSACSTTISNFLDLLARNCIIPVEGVIG